MTSKGRMEDPDDTSGFLPSGLFQRLIGRIVDWSQETHNSKVKDMALFQVLINYGNYHLTLFRNHLILFMWSIG